MQAVTLLPIARLRRHSRVTHIIMGRAVGSRPVAQAREPSRFFGGRGIDLRAGKGFEARAVPYAIINRLLQHGQCHHDIFPLRGRLAQKALPDQEPEQHE